MHVEPLTPEDMVEIESSKENVAGAILVFSEMVGTAVETGSSKENVAGAILVFSEMVGTSSFRSGGVLNMKDLSRVRVNYHIIKSILTNTKSNKQNQHFRNKTHPALLLIGVEIALNWFGTPKFLSRGAELTLFAARYTHMQDLPQSIYNAIIEPCGAGRLNG